MKYLHVLLFAALMMACGGNKKQPNTGNGSQDCSSHNHTATSVTIHEHDPDCSGHSHAGDEGHNHIHGEDCFGHDHSSHDQAVHVHDGVCNGHDHSEHNHGVESTEDEIVFTIEQAARTDFKVQNVERGPFRQVIKTSGRIMPAQGDEVSLVASAPGIVSLADSKLAEGTRIANGQTLFRVSTRNIVSGDILSRNKAAYEKARNDYERAQRLLGDQIVSQREYDEARLAYEQARVEYEAFENTGSEQGIAIKSPQTGYITSLLVSEGQYVETGTLLATVSENRSLVLRAEVPPAYLQRLANITGANFTVPYDNQTYRLDDMNGKLLSVSRNMLPGTTLIPVTFQFNNNGAVVPGTFVEVFLLGATEEGVVTVPLTAITEQQGLYYVYVQLDPECYQKREVTLGPDDGLNVKILTGLAAGERVVTRGAVSVKMAAASGAIPHTHEH